MMRLRLVTFASALALAALASPNGLSAQAEDRLVFQGGSGGNNFQVIWEWLTGALRQDPERQVQIEVVSSDGIAGLDALHAGKADFTLVKAPPTVALARRGIGLFDEPYENLRAFGLLPVPDWLTLIVRPGVRAASLADLLQQPPLRIATGRDSPRDVVTFLFQELLRFHGSSIEELERKGWTVLRLEPGASLQAALDGKVDVVFQEAQSMPLWDQLFEKRWAVVPIGAAPLAHLQRAYGFGRTTIPPEWHGGADGIETVQFSDVVLCARADTPEPLVEWVTRTFLERMPEVEEIFRKRTRRRPWLAYPVDPAFFKSPTVVPHHPGALRAFESTSRR